MNPQQEAAEMTAAMTDTAKDHRIVLAPSEAGVHAVDLSEVRANDFILIYTRNSFYSFLITDAGQLRGNLAGGAHLGKGSEALLLGAVSRRRGSRLLTERSNLKTNARALFAVAAGGEEKQLMTSAITRLVCLRGRK